MIQTWISGRTSAVWLSLGQGALQLLYDSMHWRVGRGGNLSKYEKMIVERQLLARFGAKECEHGPRREMWVI